MDICAVIQGSTVCLSADRHVIFHLRHHWNAGMLDTLYILLVSVILQKNDLEIIFCLDSFENELKNN